MNSRPNPLASISARLTENAKSLSQIATEAIEGLIADGSIRSGERINESHLAELLGISRGPIREACRRLEQAGLLDNVKNHGVFVRVLSIEDIHHLYELRSSLAGLTGRLIIQRATPEVIDELVQQVEKMSAAVEAGEAESYFQLNLEFHTQLLKASGNPALEETDTRIGKQLLLARRRGLVDAHRIGESNAEHIDIARALQARDADATAAAMQRHIDNGYARILDVS